MIKIMAKWWSDVVKCGESLDETVMKIIKEWPELAKEPRNQLGSCIFVFISWSASRSLHPKPRCWKICDFVWIVPCLHKTQLYPNIMKYELLLLYVMYLTISHCIFLTCRSYTPNKHPFTASLGFPNRSRCSACRSMMNLGESFGSTGTRTEYLLVRKTRREWMGHDGLLGLWFIDSVDHFFENSLRTAHTHQ